jgi:AcrR family transcriptional regulator
MSRPRSPAARAPDHRVRTGRARRARTEARILAAALEVFAEKGPDAPVVDDFVRAAGVARGTFYNHFQSVEQLLEATSIWTIDSAVQAIDRALRGVGGPAVRFGTGIRLFLASAEANPTWCLFVARVWKLGPLRAPRRDLRDGLRQGELHFPNIEIALDVVLGGLRETLFRLGRERPPRGYRDHVVEMCLRALGASPESIARVLADELPPLERRLMERRSRPPVPFGGVVHG